MNDWRKAGNARRGTGCGCRLDPCRSEYTQVRWGAMTANREMREYYARRAVEYERVYAKPERQDDLARLRRLLQADLAGHDVLEIACGTGYWTTAIAETA